MISNELSKPYTTRTKNTTQKYEQGYDKIFSRKKWYNLFNLSIIKDMIKKENGKWILYKGKEVVGRFGNEEVAKVWEKKLGEKKDK